MLWKQTHSVPSPHDDNPPLADHPIFFSRRATHQFRCMYLYYIFVADDARLSEALHRSHLSGTHKAPVNPCIKLMSPSSSGNPFRTMEEELLHWQPAIGFPCLDADDCAHPSNAARVPDVEVCSGFSRIFFMQLDSSQVRRNFDHVMFATHREALPFLFP